MTDKNENEKLKDELRLLKEDLADKENIINGLADDLDVVLSKVYMIDEIIAAWNDRFPDDRIHVKRPKRPESDYLLTDKEWKERTHIPHPRDALLRSLSSRNVKQFNIETGEWE